MGAEIKALSSCLTFMLARFWQIWICKQVTDLSEASTLHQCSSWTVLSESLWAMLSGRLILEQGVLHVQHKVFLILLVWS